MALMRHRFPVFYTMHKAKERSTISSFIRGGDEFLNKNLFTGHQMNQLALIKILIRYINVILNKPNY